MKTQNPKRQSALAAKVIAISLFSLLLVSYADLITGSELLFFVFYYIPVSLCAWFLGLRTAVGMAVLSGVSWYAVDRFSGHRYPDESYRYWNSFICFTAFAIIGLVLHRLRRTQVEQQRAQHELAAALADLRRSTEEIRKLQSGLQIVCAWTRRIQVDGQWMPLDQFLSDKLHVSISHTISPEAMQEIKKSLDPEPSK